MLALLPLLATSSLASPLSVLPRWSDDSSSSSSHSQCRFAPLYTADDIRSNPWPFLDDVLYWEGQFHAPNISYNAENGMSYDGSYLEVDTGLRNASLPKPFSAASKEALQIMLYAKVISGDWKAEKYVNFEHPEKAKQEVADIMTTKLETYLQFNETFPGFGGWLPWFLADEKEIRPTVDWENRIPALDNGELVWSVYAFVSALEDCNKPEWQDLLDGWTGWMEYVKTTATTIFYTGPGEACAVVLLNQTQIPGAPEHNRTCSGGFPSALNDPYEGELFTWWLYFFADLDQDEKDYLWEYKRPQLRRVEYNGSVVDTVPSDGEPYGEVRNYTGLPVVNPAPPETFGPITVQEGFWFSSHEQWKLLQMPYTDVELVDKLFHNAERVRTCNSVLMKENAGFFASINNVTNPATNDVYGYISPAGVPSVGSQQAQELDMITPYAAFPTFLFNETVGLVWYHNMLLGKGMQNPYGSTEATRRDGSGISNLVTWDSKVLGVLGLLGGTADITRNKMQRDGIYDEFLRVTEREHAQVFGDISTIQGSDVELCWPDYQTPHNAVQDFTECQ